MHCRLFRSEWGRPGLNFIGRTALGIVTGLCIAFVAQAAPRRAGFTPPATLAGDPVVMARVAFERRDRAALVSLRHRLAAAGHPLAMWPDYWELRLRLRDAKQAELDAFYARWPGTLVEERLRREWILERGKHRDMSVLATEVPRLRFFDDRADDREVECFALLLRHQGGEAVAERARELWFAQREADHGCAQLVDRLYQARQLSRDDVWARARLAAEQGRRYPAQHAIGLLRSVKLDTVHQVFLQPGRFLARRSASPSADEAELTLLAIIRLGARHPQQAAAALADARSVALPRSGVAQAWAALAREAAKDELPVALEWYQRSQVAASAAGQGVSLSADALAWKVRAALRASESPQRWAAIIEAVDAMGSAQRADPTWSYWKARALKAAAAPGAQGDASRRSAKQLLESISGQLNFYGRLAADELGAPPQLPAPPPALSDSERAAAEANPSLTRGLALMALKLREEGHAEWQHGLRGMNDRSLRAAAQRACDAQVWNVCMSTSERTRIEIDLAQRFPTPYRDFIDFAAREAELDPAQVYAVIRQESHFSAGVRSIAGASGLMQLMPHTAHWVAGRYRIPYQRERIADPALNVRLGARYFKLVLREFGGSHALAAAAYNAGPSRPRRWRHVSADDAAAWTEIIPIAETRDYVKHVLANVVTYGALIGSEDFARVRLVDAMRLRPAGTMLADTQSELPDDDPSEPQTERR
jgi:soluble lytic murein transglycosylase